MVAGDEGIACSQGTDLGKDESEEFVVCAGESYHAFNADAVLAGGLENTSHQDVGDFFEVRDRGGVVEDDGRIFPA